MKKRKRRWALALCLSLLISNVNCISYAEELPCETKLIVQSEEDLSTVENVSEAVCYDDTWILTYDYSSEAEQALSTLNEQPYVDYAEKDSLVEIEGDVYDSTMVGDFNNGDVTVAVIDTGVNGCNNEVDMTDEGNGDNHGHGTAIANQIEKTSGGVSKILSIKAIGKDGRGTVSDVYEAIVYAIDNGASIINLSLSTSATEESKCLSSIIDRATESGIKVVVSAGNKASDTANYIPANNDSAIVVSAVDEDGTFSPYSNYGSTIDYSAIGTTEYGSGTSIASAYVSGLLCLGELPQGVDLGDTGWDQYYGNTSFGVIPKEEGDSSVNELPKKDEEEQESSSDVETCQAYYSDFYLGDNSSNNGRGTWFAGGTWEESESGFNLPASYKPTRPGFTFTGWYDTHILYGGGTMYWDANLVGRHKYGVLDCGEFVAGWSGNTYRLTLNPNGGNYNSTTLKTVKMGASDNNGVGVPTRTGYTFAGWYTEANGGIPVYDTNGYAIQYRGDSSYWTGGSGWNDSWMGGCYCDWGNMTWNHASDTTLYAHWNPNTYTINYNGNGATGGSIDPQTVNYGGEWTLKTGFTRTGYSLTGYAVVRASDNAIFCGSKGWQSDYGWAHPEEWTMYSVGSKWIMDNAWINSSKTTDTFTFYAQWIPNYTMTSYHKKYNPNTGNWEHFATTTENALYGSVYAPPYSKTPTGYYNHSRDWNGGWNVSGNGTFAVYYYPNTYTQTINYYTYNASGPYNGATHTWNLLGSKNWSLLYTTTFDAYAQRTAWGNVAGYHWWSINNNSWVVSGAGATNSHYYPNAYRLTVDINGGSGTNGNFDMEYGTNKDLGTPTRTGYTFAGWKIVSNNSTGSSLSGNSFKMGYNKTYPYANYVDNATVKIQAQWTANKYTIKFNGNGSTGGSTASMTCTYNTSYNLAANGFTKTGYIFSGWNTKADGTGTKYGNKVSVENLTATNGGTVNLYAQWKANAYTITFDANGGTSSYSTLGVTYDSTANSSVAIPTRSHYTFDGWYTSANGGIKVYDANGSCTNDGTYFTSSKYHYASNLKLYAHWVLAECVTTFDTSGGTCSIPNQTDKVSVAYKTLPTATKTGWDFVGWFTERDGKGTQVKVGSTVPSVEYATLYAHYKFHPVTVTVPKKLVSDVNGNCSFKVSADNTIGKVVVSTDDTFTMSQANKNEVVTGKVTLDGNVLTPTNHSIKGRVDLTGLSCGSWVGEFSIKLNYSID